MTWSCGGWAIIGMWNGAHSVVLRDVDPAAVAAIVIASLEGAVMMSRLEKTREPLHAVGAHLAGYLQALKADGL